MTPAELDTRRRALGLTTAELAAWCGVQERTAGRWCAGVTPIPFEAINRLGDLEDMMHAKAEQLVETVTSRSMAGPIALLRYRTARDLADSLDGEELPAGAHAIYTAWAADALEAEGVEVAIRWSDESD